MLSYLVISQKKDYRPQVKVSNYCQLIDFNYDSPIDSLEDIKRFPHQVNGFYDSIF